MGCVERVDLSQVHSFEPLQDVLLRVAEVVAGFRLSAFLAHAVEELLLEAGSASFACSGMRVYLSNGGRVSKPDRDDLEKSWSNPV